MRGLGVRHPARRIGYCRVRGPASGGARPVNMQAKGGDDPIGRLRGRALLALSIGGTGSGGGWVEFESTGCGDFFGDIVVWFETPAPRFLSL